MQVHHLFLHSFISYPVYGIDHCRDTCATIRGGFQLEIPNQLLGLHISALLQNLGTILIISIILRYPVIIRSIHAHPEQLSAISESKGREQLSLWSKSLSCLEISKIPHVPGILSGTGRLSVLEIGNFIGHLLH